MIDNLKKIEILQVGAKKILINAEPNISYELVISGAANMSISQVSLESRNDRSALIDIPQQFVESIRQLYSGEIYFWIEGRNQNKRLSYISNINKLQ